MLKTIVDFVDKVPERKWGEEKLRKYLEESGRGFFFAVTVSTGLKYKGFHTIGIENPFPNVKILSNKFVNLTKWIEKNPQFVKFTEFGWYRKPIGGNNFAVGGSNALGTRCLSHFEIQNIGKDKLSGAKNKNYRKALLPIFEKRIRAHVKAIDAKLVENKPVLEKCYIDFFSELTKIINDQEALKKIFKKDVIFFNEKILGLFQLEQIDKIKNLEPPRYFNEENRKKPFSIQSRTRPIKQSMLISSDEQNKIHEFIVRILPDLGPTFILPLNEKLREKMAKNIAKNDKNFFSTVESLLGELKQNRFDFYFADIRNGEINFFDYVSNYEYEFKEHFLKLFPLSSEKAAMSFNRRHFVELVSTLLGQKIVCLPWVDLPKNLSTSKKSAFIQLREKLFETIYLGKAVLTLQEVKNLCLLLTEESIVNENYIHSIQLCNESLNFFINSHLYISGGETLGSALISKAEKIKEQANSNNFTLNDQETAFYFLGVLLKKLCDKSETSNEKSRLLQPIINTHTISGLNRVVLEKFVEKYSYKLDDEKDTTAKSLINVVLPFLAEQNGEEPIKDLKLWLYAGFFSNH